MMKDSTKHTSDEILGVVVSFMCHLVCSFHTHYGKYLGFNAMQALLSSFSNGEWEKHRAALVRIVALRGGYDAIKVDHLRIVLAWYV